MRFVVIVITAVAFLAALIFDTGALIRLPFVCATGGCGPYGKWAVLAFGAGVIGLGVAAAVTKRRRRSSTGKRASSGKRARRPASKPKPGTPARPARGVRKGQAS